MSTSNLSDILKKDTLQTLNDDKLSRFGLRRDAFASNFDTLSEAVGKLYSDALSDDGQDEYQARCLAAVSDPTNSIPGVLDNSENNSNFLVRENS